MEVVFISWKQKGRSFINLSVGELRGYVGRSDDWGACFADEPAASQVGVVEGEPLNADNRRRVAELVRVEEADGFGGVHDVDADILIFFADARYDPVFRRGGAADIDRCELGQAAWAWIIGHDLTQIRDFAAGFLFRFAACRGFVRFAGFDDSGDNFKQPWIVFTRHSARAKLLDHHDFVLKRVKEEDGDGAETTIHHFAFERGTPPAHKAFLAEAVAIDAEIALEKGFAV